MAKIVTSKAEGIVEAPKGDREARWDAYVKNYAKENPVKFAAKEANGEFAKIPDSFK